MRSAGARRTRWNRTVPVAVGVGFGVAGVAGVAAGDMGDLRGKRRRPPSYPTPRVASRARLRSSALLEHREDVTGGILEPRDRLGAHLAPEDAALVGLEVRIVVGRGAPQRPVICSRLSG